MKTTKYGQFIRKLRIERGIVLKDMADDLSVSVAMLSAMELGKRKIRDDLLTEIIKKYNLSEIEELELYKAAVSSLTTIDIDVSDKPDEVKELTAAFARRVNDGAILNIDAIRRLLEE
jgi:transcriptional regulator with XRE-family HTH domain